MMNRFPARLKIPVLHMPAWLGLLLILSAALLWKLLLLGLNAFPFNSDEAIVALMARHILTGERPIFFYGQAYMGSLDAYLVALGFRWFGEQVWVIRVLQSLLYLGVILSTYFIGKEAFHSSKIGLIAAIFLAVPTVNTALYTTVSLGGYGEALLLGCLILWIGVKLSTEPPGIRSVWISFFSLGLLAGMGLWVHGLTLVFSTPVAGYLFWVLKNDWKRMLIRFSAGFIGVCLGLLPVWIYVFQHGFGAVWAELFGSAVAVESGNFLLRSLTHALSLLLFGVPVMFGFRPPWSPAIQQVWLLPPVLIFLVWIGFVLYRDLRSRSVPSSSYLFMAIVAVVTAAFLFTSFGVDPSGRYFLPLIIPGSLLAGYAIEKIRKQTRWVWLFLLGFIVYQGWVTLSVALKPPFLTTQFYAPAQIDHRYDEELIRFLQEQHLNTGYTNYWVSYPLAFQSAETLIYVPKLPYHPDLRYTARDNRYVAYNVLVEGSKQNAYIVTHNPPLEAVMQERFSQMNVTYRFNEIGDYHIYYHLSSRVTPEEILGNQKP